MEKNDFTEIEDNSATTHPSVTELSNILNNIAKEAFESISESEFVSAYKSIFEDFTAKEGERPLNGSTGEGIKLQNKLYEMFKTRVSEGIEGMISEANLSDSFGRVERLQLEESSKDHSCKWRPPGDAEKHMVPFELAATLEEKTTLEALLQKETSDLQILKHSLSAKRESVIELDKVIRERTLEIEKKFIVSLD